MTRGAVSLLAIAVLAGVWYLGRLQGEAISRDSLETALHDRIGALESTLAATTDERDELLTRLAVSEGTVAALRDGMAGSARQALADAEELALYRRIASDAASAGLQLDSLVRVASEEGDAERLRVTLVQVRGRERVAGRVSVALLVGGSGEPIPWIDAQGNTDAAFDFRFFQVLEWPVPNGAKAGDRLEITVQPSGGSHKSTRLTRVWGEIPLNRPQYR